MQIRSIAEHAVVPDRADPLGQTRTVRAGWLERLFIDVEAMLRILPGAARRAGGARRHHAQRQAVRAAAPRGRRRLINHLSQRKTPLRARRRP